MSELYPPAALFDRLSALNSIEILLATEIPEHQRVSQLAEVMARNYGQWHDGIGDEPGRHITDWFENPNVVKGDRRAYYSLQLCDEILADRQSVVSITEIWMKLTSPHPVRSDLPPLEVDAPMFRFNGMALFKKKGISTACPRRRGFTRTASR